MTRNIYRPDASELDASELALLGGLERTVHVVEQTGRSIEFTLRSIAQTSKPRIQSYSDLPGVLEKIRFTRKTSIIIVRVKNAINKGVRSSTLRPLLTLASERRRKLIIIVIADDVRSKDGNNAFNLAVNCVKNSKDEDQIDGIVLEAALCHLRLYQFWLDAEDVL